MGIYSSNGKTYLTIDDKNIDATLGLSILECRSSPEEHPRWGRILGDTRRTSDEEAKGLFFLNGFSGALLIDLVRALTAMGYTVVPLSGPEDVRVMDVGLQHVVEAIRESESDNTILASHDAGFAPRVEHLPDLEHNVAIIYFHEFSASSLHELEEEGLRVINLEYNVHTFQATLPRLHIIDVGGFNPFNFL